MYSFECLTYGGGFEKSEDDDDRSGPSLSKKLKSPEGSRASGIASMYGSVMSNLLRQFFFVLIRYTIPIIKRVSTIPVAADAPTISTVLSVDFEGI